MRRGTGFVVVVCVGLCVLAFTPATEGVAEAQAQKTLKIGVLASLSGWFAGFDTAQWEECQAVAQVWNERGGLKIKGEQYKIELLVEDNKSTLDGVTASCNKLHIRRGSQVPGRAGRPSLQQPRPPQAEPCKSALRVLSYAPLASRYPASAKTPLRIPGRQRYNGSGQGRCDLHERDLSEGQEVVFSPS